MPEVSWSLDGRRPLIDVLIFSPTRMQSVPAQALVDTGATASAITAPVADSLGLPILGKRLIGSAHGDQFVDRHIFRIGLPVAGAAYPYIFEAVDGFQIREGFEFNAIIGMDVLSACDLVMSRDGSCTLRYG